MDDTGFPMLCQIDAVGQAVPSLPRSITATIKLGVYAICKQEAASSRKLPVATIAACPNVGRAQPACVCGREL